MPKSEKEIVYSALRRISVIASDEEPDASLYADALAEYEGFHHWLEKEFDSEILWDFDSVDDDIWVYVAGWFAGQLRNVIPCGEAASARALANSIKSEESLREILSRSRTRGVAAEYF